MLGWGSGACYHMTLDSVIVPQGPNETVILRLGNLKTTDLHFSGCIVLWRPLWGSGASPSGLQALLSEHFARDMSGGLSAHREQELRPELASIAPFLGPWLCQLHGPQWQCSQEQVCLLMMALHLQMLVPPRQLCGCCCFRFSAT